MNDEIEENMKQNTINVRNLNFESEMRREGKFVE